jgi:prephenate dehydrogenase
MFVEHLEGAGAEICIVDTAPAPASPASPGRRRYLRADITEPGSRLGAELSGCDLVMLAVPEQVALAAARRVASLMCPGALLVDTVSVKSRLVDALRAAACGIEVVSLNPMFAPALGMADRPVAAVVVHDGPRTQQLLRLIAAWGGRVVRQSAEEHDRLAAGTQALTHAAVLAFGLALADLDVPVGDLGAVAPPPHTTLLALLARIVSGAPEVYWDVQAANPNAALARTGLAEAARRLAELADRGDRAEFTSVLDHLRGFLGTDLAHYGDLCAGLLARRGVHPEPAQSR